MVKHLAAVVEGQAAQLKKQEAIIKQQDQRLAQLELAHLQSEAETKLDGKYEEKEKVTFLFHGSLSVSHSLICFRRTMSFQLHQVLKPLSCFGMAPRHSLLSFQTKSFTGATSWHPPPHAKLCSICRALSPFPNVMLSIWTNKEKLQKT